MDTENEKQIMAAVEAAARSAAAAGHFAADLICLLSQHPGVDKGLLLDQLNSLYADPKAEETFQTVYNNFRARAVRFLQEHEQGRTPGQEKE